MVPEGPNSMLGPSPPAIAYKRFPGIKEFGPRRALFGVAVTNRVRPYHFSGTSRPEFSQLFHQPHRSLLKFLAVVLDLGSSRGMHSHQVHARSERVHAPYGQGQAGLRIGSWPWILGLFGCIHADEVHAYTCVYSDLYMCIYIHTCICI